MSKPRWIDTGVFRTLRTATRKRSLAVVVGPRHGNAEVSNRAQLRKVLGERDPASFADDPRLRSEADEGLCWLFRLRQPGLVTTAVSDALEASIPPELESRPRVMGPTDKGLRAAWDRKEPFVVHLVGSARRPETLILSERSRKELVAPDSRYQVFLRAAFSRTVLFTGFDLADPDLLDLLGDVARGFNGHVPANIALIPAGSAEPAAALRASMHFGTTIVEFPAEAHPSEALAELTRLLVEFEVPKPATGNPPPGYTELDEKFRGALPAPTDAAVARFDAGDTGDWTCVQAGLDVPRAVSPSLEDFLLGETIEGKVRVCVVRGLPGSGKTTLARRLAWDLSVHHPGVRVFWRERGAALSDEYVPAEGDSARAVFVADDADDLGNLPILLRHLAAKGAGKARLALAADDGRWERSGLDHRLRVDAELQEVVLGAPDAQEARSLAVRLAERGRLGPDLDVAQASTRLADGKGPFLERVLAASGRGGLGQEAAAVWEGLSTRPDADLLRRAWLAVAIVHRHGMAMSSAHLAGLLGLPPEELAERVVRPLGTVLLSSGDGGLLRTAHPLAAEAAVSLLAPAESALDEMVVELLRALPGGRVADHTILHAPSELIRARRQSPLPPLTLGRFFEAGEEAARHDVLFWFDRGRYESDFARWQQALAAFDQALWQRPEDASEREHNALVHANRARCLQSLGEKRAALRAVEDGLRQAPRDATLLRLQERFDGRRRPAGPGGRGARRGAGDEGRPTENPSRAGRGGRRGGEQRASPPRRA